MGADLGAAIMPPRLQQSSVGAGHEGHFIGLDKAREAGNLLPVPGNLGTIDAPTGCRPELRFGMDVEEDGREATMHARPMDLGT